MNGKVIRLIRADHNLSMREVARLAGLHESTISLIENGHLKLQPENEKRIKQALIDLGVTEERMNQFKKLVERGDNE
jgi:transcriptional regulator with XRE-family HTH domain